jgi:ECF sigma factor
MLDDLRYAAARSRPRTRDEDLVALDEALSRLEKVDARACRVVELQFFTG